MKTRKVYILKDDSFTAARTKTQDINVIDPIASIDIIVEMTNGNAMTEASVVKPHDEFTKIEITDGADVLVSASMEELQALNVAELKALPYMGLTLEDSAVQKEMCRIHFGLGRNDPNHYLRPQDFANLQIKITNTFTTAAATSWAASGHYLTVIANVIDDGAGEYKGFLTTKSMYSFTAVDGAVETIDMPRDYPYRLIQIQALKTAARPDESIEKIKLTCDADKYIPIDVDCDHQVLENLIQFGRFSQVCKKRVKDADDKVYGDLYYDTDASVSGGTTLYATTVQSVDAEAVGVSTYAQT